MYSLLIIPLKQSFLRTTEFFRLIDAEKKLQNLLKVLLFVFLQFPFIVRSWKIQTMGQAAGPTMKVTCFNPGSRLKEKLQDEALNH